MMNMDSSRSAKTVMIVDDELFFRKVLREILEKDGFTVVAEAVDGIEAVENYTLHRPEIILMDIYMPRSSGMDATKEILAINRGAKVLICSGQGYDEDAQASLAIGARYVILKPFIRDEVLEIMNKAFLED